MNHVRVIRIFLLVIGNMLAIVLGCLSLLTTQTNFIGWVLLFFSIGYGAGGAFYIWRSRDMSGIAISEVGNYSFWWILPGFITIFFAPPLEYLYMKQILPRGIGMELTGLVLIVAGLSIRIWSRLGLGKSYSGYLRVKNEQALVKIGPYRYVRHPGYTGFLLMGLGLSVGYSSLVGLLAIPCLLLPGLAYRLRVEEKLLMDSFGDDYKGYISQTRRLIPGIW
jgi:protein-S-isoprenylcysteine O-methyltransferase Ste14